jgi:formylglycine-generating enzyme required for sulfatase activity
LRRTGYRLPTDAEWEYSCRAGTTTSRYYGASVALLKHYAWFVESSPDRALPCGRLLPNELGLFDMLGNVHEWVQDRSDHQVQLKDELTTVETVNTVNPRVYRGGTVDNRPATLRSANRFWGAPSNRDTDGGFRLVRTLP